MSNFSYKRLEDLLIILKEGGYIDTKNISEAIKYVLSNDDSPIVDRANVNSYLLFRNTFRATLALEVHKFLDSYRDDCLDSLDQSMENCRNFSRSKNSDDLIVWAIGYYNKIVVKIDSVILSKEE
ncbi:MAG: hypothetical protein V3U58_04495 [Thermodesulfobacteriota bacterium]